MSEQQAQPYKRLGERLRGLRQHLRETVAEVSGAVEIDEDVLTRIEQGRERPSEDILLLLISHFDMQESEAAGLWQLAGYEQPDEHSHDHHHEHDPVEEATNGRAAVLVMAIDPRVIYSDGAHVAVGPNGVIINFAQASGTPNSLTTARVGMSRSQAYRLVETLQTMLYKSEPRRLPASGSSNSATPNDAKEKTSEDQHQA